MAIIYQELDETTRRAFNIRKTPGKKKWKKWVINHGCEKLLKM
jgi:hypothetical protein